MTSNNPKKIVGSGSTPHKKHFGQGGCPAMTDGRRCGETKNLQIIQEFKRLYESKMRQIDDAAGGDCFQAKITLQQEWIKDLTDQNEMLVKVVEELEVEAAERVTMLEEKLQHSAKCACEHEKLAKEKDKQVKELQEKIKKLDEEARRSCQQYAELKKSMLDMRDALTAEVAEKHDMILCLRRDMLLLEEQCKKADQQTHFKDDIIKELRREIKQLKLQRSKKTRSPRTVRRCDQRPLHSSHTDPDTNIRSLKDGTIVIRDIETVGDSVATQTIKEKYSDPCNQTIVYICESIPQRQKSKSRENSRLEVNVSPSQSPQQQADSRNCEVSLDDSQSSRCRHLAGSPENSRDLTLDLPRDASADVSRDSESNLIQRNYWAYPSIHETCIRYSKDILNMLNNHSLEEKRTVGEHIKNGVGENAKSLNASDMKCLGEDQLADLKLKEATGDAKEGDSNCFLSETLNRCEKYFLDMFQEKCKLAMEKAKSLDEAYSKKYSCDCKQTCGDCCINLEKYEAPKNCAMLKDIYPMDLNNMSTTNDAACCPLHAVHTGACYRHNKDTQTNEVDLLGEVNSPQLLPKENDFRNNPKYTNCSTECGDDQLQFSKTTNVPTEETWNNVNTKSDDVSFDEAELRGYSSPYHDELPTWQQIDSQKYQKFDQFYPQEHLARPSLMMHQQTHRFCELPARKVPLMPIKRYVLPPQMRQSKALSSRTMRRISRCPMEVPLSFRSQSLPTCTDVYSRHDLHRPVRLHRMKKQTGFGERGFVDVAFVMDDGNFCGKPGPEDLHGYVDLSGRDGINASRSTREDCFDHWPNMNNTY